MVQYYNDVKCPTCGHKESKVMGHYMFSRRRACTRCRRCYTPSEDEITEQKKDTFIN